MLVPFSWSGCFTCKLRLLVPLSSASLTPSSRVPANNANHSFCFTRVFITTETLVPIVRAHPALAALGTRLRLARRARGESMARFAERIGVSTPTLRAAEQGLPTVGIGVWIAALWELDRLDDLSSVLAEDRGKRDDPAPGVAPAAGHRFSSPHRHACVYRPGPTWAL